MNTPHRIAHKIGTCEVGRSDGCKSGQQIEVWTRPGNILMCSDCINLESELTKKYEASRQLIIDSRKQDTSVEIIQDLFNAKTVAASELYATIQSDDSIPNEEKDYRFNKEMELRYETLKVIIQREELALNEKRNEAAMWKTQIQTTVPRLHAKYQEEFKKFLVNYTPSPTKPTKTAVTPGKPKLSKAQQLDECMKWAKHYSVDASVVHMMVIQLKKYPTAEAAAKSLFDAQSKVQAKLSE